MGIFDGVLLASDYDATLRGKTLKVLDRDIRALEYFQEEGGKFVLTTGRCWSAFVQQARELPLQSPTLLSNGASFCRMETGELLFNYDLPLRCREDMALLAAQFPDVAFETYHGEEVYCQQPNDYTAWHMSLVKATYTELPLEEMPLPWLKVLLEGERSELEAMKQVVLERWGEYYECIFSNEHLLELTAKNVHKGTGVRAAAEWFGIAPEHIYCVGDNDNDLPMLTTARIGFAPEGSVVAAKNLPGIRVVRDCESGCVESVIEILREIYG